MALTDDQRAMLQLLLEGGQRYPDLASLLGVDEPEVRRRARAALAEIAGADPDAQVGLTDYLLGQADPIGRADAARHLQQDPAAHELATRLSAQLRLVAPRAALPEIPEPRGGRRAPAPAAAAPPPGPAPAGAAPPGPAPPGPAPPGAAQPGGPAAPGGRIGGLGSRIAGAGGRLRRLPPRAWIAGALAAGALAVLLVVLAVAGVFGGDGDGGEPAPAATNPDLVIVALAPLGEGSGASGQATFAPTGNQLLVQLNLSGLAPTGRNQAYIAWLYASDRLAFPLGFFGVNQSGNFTGPAPIPQQLTRLVDRFGCIDISLVTGREAQREIQRAIKARRLPGHSGDTVLRGEIPAAGVRGASGAASQCGGTAAAGGAEGAPQSP